MQHEEELKRFQTKVKKSPSKSMTTEFQDSYKGFIYIPEEKVYVPSQTQERLDYLEGPVYKASAPIESNFAEKHPNPTEVEYNQLKNGTQYRNFYGKLRSDNQKELYDVLYDNFKEIYPKKIGYKTQIPRKDLYHVENFDEYQQETHQYPHDEEIEQEQEQNRRFQSIQQQQQDIQQQIEENNRQLQLKEQLKNEENIVNLKNELQILQNEQNKLSNEIQNLERGQSGNTYQPIAPIPEDEHRLHEREQRVNKFTQESRKLPNSAFTSYYGKPAFANYGSANVKDKNAGFVSGNYLKSHNVNPHRGEIKPEYEQTYENAINLGNNEIHPNPPRHRLDQIPTKKQLEYNRKTNPFYPNQNKLLTQSRKGEVITASNVNKVHPLLRKSQTKEQITIHNHNEIEKKSKTGLQVPANSKISPNNSQNSKQNQNEEEVEFLAQDRSPYLVEPHPSVESEQSSKQNIIFEQSKFRQSANNFKDNRDVQNSNQGKMNMLNKKKEKQNLIVSKVTDCPEYDIITFQTRADNYYDDMNPPQGYLHSLHDCELNPQYYKNVNKQWLKKVPYAGKKAMVKEDLFQILQHQPYGADPVY